MGGEVKECTELLCEWAETDHIRTSCGFVAPLSRNQGSRKMAQCPNCRREISYTPNSVICVNAEHLAKGVTP
jgi:hypothetical protein